MRSATASDDARFIETVPKLGYRFVAPVQKVSVQGNGNGDAPPTIPMSATAGIPPAASHDVARAANAESGANAMEVAAAPPSKRFAWLAATVALVLIVALAGWSFWRNGRHVDKTIAAAPDSSAVAIVDFNNLSGNAKDAWLGPALEQMLATEVASGGKLHAVSEELVRPARADLPAPDAGGYAPASLDALQHRLGAHYVLSGAYLVSGNPDKPQLRVDLTVQDAQNGASFASITRESAISDLPNLVAQMGAVLRNRFGESTDPVMLKQIASAQPASAEVARHIGFALQALEQYDAARARDELLQAIAQSPGYAPAYLYLARAWAALGYRAKAIAAAKQAAQYTAGLPREEQLQIQAQQALVARDSGQTISLLQQLVALRPGNPEYRLQWIAALTGAGKYEQARTALNVAAKLPELRDDPRIELAAANIESSSGRPFAAIPHARSALQQAQKRGAAGLVAESELQLGMALDQNAQAEPMLRQAAADFRSLGNPHGEAQAWQNLGNLQRGRSQIAAARENYQRAMTIYQGVGDLGGEAAIYENLSNMLWAAGDRDGTETALRQALAIARETGDQTSQAWALAGLATVLSDASASDEVAAMYREAIALDRKAGARGHLAFALSLYADLLRMRGDFEQARAACAQAQVADRELQAGSQTIGLASDFECAQIELDQGDVVSATDGFRTIEAWAIKQKDPFYTANAQLVLGQIAMGRGQWSNARDILRQSMQGWAANEESTGEATASALLALCADALHDNATRDHAAARARELRSSVTQRAEAFELDVALAELQAAQGQAAQAKSALRVLADDATKREWPGLAFDARLASLRVLSRGMDATAIQSAREALIADARNAGFGWVAGQATMR